MTGEGAQRSGGRWNSPGLPMVYAAETFAGSMLEVLIHMNRLKLPKNRVYVEISIAESRIACAAAEDVPGWNREDPTVARAFGDKWLRERRSLGLLVPNLATGGVERNLLINPSHRDFPEVIVSNPAEVIWDARLFTHPRGPL